MTFAPYLLSTFRAFFLYIWSTTLQKKAQQVMDVRTYTDISNKV